MTAVLHGQSLHKSYEDWLVHKTQGPLPAPVLVLDADQGIDNMITTYETYKVKMLYLIIVTLINTGCADAGRNTRSKAVYRLCHQHYKHCN